MSLLLLTLTLNYSPIFKDGHFYLPMRASLENIGYDVYYDNNITLSTKNDDNILIINNNKDTYINLKKSV